MQKYDVHFCLVSNQAAANLLPVLDDSFKPEKVVLVVSPDMVEKANTLKLVFEAKGIQVDERHIESVSNFEYLEKFFTSVLEEYKETNVALNATGGTKSMVVAGNNVFRKAGKAVFYLEARNNTISFLYNEIDGSYLKDYQLNSNYSLETYLAAYGVKSNPTVLNVNQPRLNAVVAAFIDGYNTFNPYVYKLNWYSSQVNDFKAKLTNEDLSDHNFIKLLSQLVKADKNKGVLGFDGKTINYRNPDDKFFIGGGWFEEFAYTKLKENELVKDIQCSLHVNNDIYGNDYQNDDFERNELDVVFMANDKLHIIECKTGKISATTGAAIIYKLKSLKEYGGLMTKTCLLSYEKVPSSVKSRAKAAGVHIISAWDLKNFDKNIEKWIGER